MDMAIHNLVNNLYSKDISKKLKSALRVKWKNGQWTGGKPPFGYLRRFLIRQSRDAVLLRFLII